MVTPRKMDEERVRGLLWEAELRHIDDAMRRYQERQLRDILEERQYRFENEPQVTPQSR